MTREELINDIGVDTVECIEQGYKQGKIFYDSFQILINQYRNVHTYGVLRSAIYALDLEEHQKDTLFKNIMH